MFFPFFSSLQQRKKKGARMSCVATCSGFSSLRSECIANPCFANNLCQIANPSIPNCAEWCCQGRGGYVFFMIFFFCLGAFLLCAAYYLHRLHQENVKSGAVTADGKKAVAAVDQTPQQSRRLKALFTPSGAVSLTPAR